MGPGSVRIPCLGVPNINSIVASDTNSFARIRPSFRRDEYSWGSGTMYTLIGPILTVMGVLTAFLHVPSSSKHQPSPHGRVERASRSGLSEGTSRTSRV